jgi:Sel1 repeat
MQRLNAATCLLFALFAQAAFLHGAGRVKLEVVQTHTGVKRGDSGAEVSAAPESAWTRCSGTTGIYARELGFYCRGTDSGLMPEPKPSRAGYAFFYDVSVIMPDDAHLVLHCSSVLSKKCEGFPNFPENTSVVCSNFAFAQTQFKDCTASGLSRDGIGVYEAALHGDKVTIFGPKWQRNYLKYGTWRYEDDTPQEPSPPPSTAPSTPPSAAPGPAPSAAPAQDSKGMPAPPPAATTDEAIDVQVIEQAKAGDQVAQYKLGYDYYLGHGIAQDYAQAAVWWRKAADQGNAEAMNNLGVLYNSGKGVPQSFAEAYFWENLAAARANGALQAQFAKNRDDSGAKLWLFERLGVQRRAAKWAAAHPVPPRSAEPKPAQP